MQDKDQNQDTNSNLEDDLEKLKEINGEITDSLKRAQADLVNFRKRTADERLNLLKYQGFEILFSLLPVIDNFDRAFLHIPEKIKEDPWVKGVVQIENQFRNILDKIGVKKMESIGEVADYSRHEVISQMKGKRDVIIEDIESGYLYHDRILRPAKVIVGNGEEA